ncbi:serine hydrolase [Atopobium fossor]|uniref:serine hydrolase n=1 Tax=Atopobium fossor TaxID=39487 RepID=UPI00041218D8|nr:serine hydrolase [Atopobium fossor]
MLGLLVILGLLIALISCGMRYTKAKKTKQNAAISPTTTARAALSNDASPRINTDKDATIVDYDKDGILVHAPEGFTDTSSYGELVDAVDEFESYGYTLSFSLLDLNTGRSLDYNKDTALYPASAIKAAYTAMVYETHGGASGLAGVAENCIVNSDNESFHTLIHTFGLSSYGNWLTQHGAPNAGQIAYVHYYPKISAAELSNVWQEIFRYGVSGEKGSEEFTNFLAQSNHTSMGGLLRDRYTVWAKPGWYPKDGTGNEATVDAGVVFSDCGPYVFVVMSNAPEDFNAMFPLEDALNAAHGCMCGGSIDLLQTDYTSLPGIS